MPDGTLLLDVTAAICWTWVWSADRAGYQVILRLQKGAVGRGG
jgi:hypothetical protein